ncbi:MAG: LysR family transcriptional regulator [Ideonella sp. WA131b]|jgi:DNA-binding transcriptional LysR family regulator|nr:LysR family transcriptional regulator [Ideonella sp. WA131b]
MTLVQLRHLLSLARTGSFSRSAAALFITQPALSRSIGALESELGQRLFDRIGRRSELTPFGREMAERAGELVLAADDLRERARRLAPAVGGSGDEGTLRVGLGSGPGSMLMTPLLLQCALQHPRLQLQVARAATEQLVQALRERTLDALVVDARSLRPAPDLDTRELHEMRGAFLVRRGHPLARRRAPADLALLRQYPVASTPLSDEVARVLVERYGPQAHPDVLVTLRCDELPSLVEVARRSDAVLLAIRAAAPDLTELRLAPALQATARFGLVTLRRRTEPPGLQTLQALMRERLRDAA